MEKNTKKRTAALIAACGLLGAAGTGAALAYLTDGETATNTFVVGDVSIEGIEPNWPGNDSDDPKDIVPNEELPKDPQIDNKGVNDAIVFMTVDSPMENVTIINDDGTVNTAKGINEIFWFKDAADTASTHANNFDSGWEHLTAKEMYVKIAADGTETVVAQADLADTYAALEADDVLVKRYVFGYKQAIQGSTTHDGSEQTAENKKTSALFDKIQLKNILENEIDEATEKVVVRSYAIQASEILEDSADLTDSLTAENLGKIYDVFVRQNSTGDDATGLKVEGLRDVDSVTATSNGASGSEDAHVNRWDDTTNVSGEGANVKPTSSSQADPQEP